MIGQGTKFKTFHIKTYDCTPVMNITMRKSNHNVIVISDVA